MALVVRELYRPRNGSWTMVQAQVRAVLVIVWRLSGVEEFAVKAQGEASRILQRFRQLVEMHFRDRWPVRAYAGFHGLKPPLSRYLTDSQRLTFAPLAQHCTMLAAITASR